MPAAQRGITSALAAVVILALLPAAPAEAGARQRGSCYTYSAAEKGLATATNRSRAGAGVMKLRLDPQLSRVARLHAREMTKAGRLFHQSSGQMKRRITRWIRLGENVGYGAGVASLERAFMHSPLHRANILGRGSRYLGVGVVRKNGFVWATVLFESRRDPGTTLRMPAC